MACARELELSNTDFSLSLTDGTTLDIAGTYTQCETGPVNNRPCYEKGGLFIFFNGESWEIGDQKNVGSGRVLQYTQNVCPSGDGGDWVYTGAAKSDHNQVPFYIFVWVIFQA